MIENDDFFKISYLGLTICITFSNTELTKERDYCFHYIKNVYKQYIVKNTIKHQFTVEFKEPPDRIISIKKQNTNYAPLYLKKTNKYILYYYLHPIVFNIIFREIILNYISGYGGFIVHSSAVIFKKKLILFMGKSGNGKSSIVQFLQAKYRAFTDDLVCIFPSSKYHTYLAYQLPLPEKNVIPTNKNGYPIAKIYLLKKASQKSKITKMDHLSTVDLFPYLFSDEKNISLSIKSVSKFLLDMKVEFLMFVTGNIINMKKTVSYNIFH